MVRVFIADALASERSALRLMVLSLEMEISGEAADWPGTLSQTPASRTDMLLIDWDLLPVARTEAVDTLRKVCPAEMIIVLISHLEVRQQAALSAGADTFTSKWEMPERVAANLLSAAANLPTKVMPPP